MMYRVYRVHFKIASCSCEARQGGHARRRLRDLQSSSRQSGVRHAGQRIALKGWFVVARQNCAIFLLILRQLQVSRTQMCGDTLAFACALLTFGVALSLLRGQRCPANNGKAVLPPDGVAVADNAITYSDRGYGNTLMAG